MTKTATKQKAPLESLPKCRTGIQGLDEITGGGLPKGRPTLVCGSAGCGKTLLGIEFLVRGAMRHDEPGVFIAFEETAEELTQNVRSLGFDLDDLIDGQESDRRSSLDAGFNYHLVKPTDFGKVRQILATVFAQAP